MKKNVALFALFAISFVTSCGGGGGGASVVPAGGAPAVTNFSGVAVDGYLYQARAFLDLNGNGQYDSGEPTATTDANGGFTLSATQDQINSYSVIVSAIAGTTIDQDSPNTPLTTGMTLVAPAGSPSVVSPLTTQVSAKMAAGLTLEAAKSAVQTELGLSNIDVMKNFVAEKATNSAYTDVHKVAASVAEVLKNIETQSSSNTTLANRLSSLTTTVTSQIAPNVAQIKAATSVDDAKTVMRNTISQSVNIYSIGGSISGLTSSGLVLANGVGTVSPRSGANSFTFANKSAAGGSYAVTVQSNPMGQICTVTNGTGTVGSQSVTNVSVSCSNTPGTLGGTITGLSTSGLVLKNDSDELTVTSGVSSFQFSSTVVDGAAYAVTVKTQPTGKTCSVSNSSGTMGSAGVTNVQVTCSANSYAISGSISGLTASGLKLKNSSEVLTISSGSTSFALSTQVAFGGAYAVVVDTQPTGQTCSLTNASGTMSAANVTAVQVTCSINSYSISGSISGLNASGLKLKNGSETLSLSKNATSFIFTSTVAFGGSYFVTVDTQPTYPISCALLNGNGSQISQNITNISLSCEPIKGASLFIAGGAAGYVNGTGGDASFGELAGMARDSSGNIYVADPTNNRIRKITPIGDVTTFAGNEDGAVTNADLYYPSDVAIDASGNIYVCDTGNNRIRKISPAGVISTLAGTGATGSANGPGSYATFDRPRGIDVDSSGNVYVADSNNHQIRKITPSGNVSRIAGSGSPGSVDGIDSNAKFDFPIDVAVSSSGLLFISDRNNHLIRKITGQAVTTYAGTNGVTGFASGQGTAAKFNGPSYLAINSLDELYVSDTYNNQIRKVTSTGFVMRWVGERNATAGSFAEGYRTSVYLSGPSGLALDANQNLYFSSNGKILKVLYDTN